MTKNRLYNKENKAVGTLYMDGNRETIGLQFQRYSKLREDFIKCVNNFLKKNNLKPVSSPASFRKHHNHKEYNINIKGIELFYKTKNPKTQKIEVKSISSLNHRKVKS